MRRVRSSRLSSFTALVCALLLIAPHVALAATPLRAPTAIGPQAVDPQGPPEFDVDYSQDSAWGTGWTPDVYASVYVGSLTDPAWAASTPTDGSGSFNIHITYDVAPGDTVWVSEGPNLRSLLIAELTVTEVNAIADTVSGTAAPGAQDVSVGFDGDPYYAEPVVVQPDGTWTVDFSGDRDIVPGSQGNVRQGEGDGDATHIRWRARTPVFRVSAEGDSLWGNDWLPGAQLTIRVGDPATPDHTAYATADGTGNFNTPAIAHDIHVGDTVTVSDAEITKDTVVTDLAVTGLDVDADTVSGTAQPNAPVFVNLNTPDGGRFRNVQANASGDWSADFSVAVGPQPQDQTWDLTPGVDGGVDEYDADGDGTNVAFRINNPWFRVSRWDDNVWGSEWQPNTGITITVGDPGSPEHTFSTSTDEWGNFNAGGIGFDLDVDSLVTVDDGQYVKDHVVTALTVDFVDAETDTIMGLANAGASVNVWVNAPGGGIQRQVTADAGGFWMADFATPAGAEPWQQVWDIAPGANGSAEEYDDDFDGTQVPWQLNNPSFAVDPEHDSLWGWQWEPGIEVGITIGALLDPDYSDAVWCDEWGNWNLDITGYDVQPGETVTVFSEGTLKEHVVRDVAVTGVDPDTDQVHGTASPGATVWVDINYEGIQREVIADAEGSWTADFSEPVGEEPWQQAADIARGTEGAARETDEDGDSTQVTWRVPNPSFTVNPATDDIWGNDWPASTTLSITVGTSAPYAYEGTVDTSEWGDFGAWIEYDLVAGNVVTVTDGETPKVHQVTQLTLTEVNTELDTVSGTAEPGTVVRIDVNADWGEWSGREAEANQLGAWTADFSVAGAEEWQGVFDIAPGTQVNANQNDEDGDVTYAGQRVPNPTFTANAQDDEFWGSEWEPLSQVMITVGTEEPLDFGQLVDVDEWGNFNLWGIEYDLKPGDFVTVSDGIMTKTHTVSLISVSDIDLELDTVSGMAEPGAIFLVDANDDWGGWSSREVEADGSGFWTADFSIAGPGEGQEPFDLRPGVFVGASVPDEDGDATWAGTRIPNPCFAVNADDDQFWGWEWAPDSQVTITVGDAEPYDYEGTVSTDEWGNFGTDYGIHDVHVGELVTVTDGTSTKQHVVLAVAVTEVDAQLDTVSGTAPPGAMLWVDANNNWESSGRDVTADAGGIWTADFSVQGPEDWQQPFDIGPGTWVNANLSDDDGDQTNAGRYLANPVFRANPRDDELFGHEWPGGAELQVTVGDPGAPDFEGTAAADEWGDFSLALEGYDLVSGNLVTVTDGSTVKQHYVTELVIEGVDADADTVYGTAEPGSWVDVFPHDAEGVGRWLQADEVTGEWLADFSGEYDMQAGSNGTAMQYDEDDDATWAYWSVPQPQFRADPVHDDIWGWEFLDGPTVTIVVGSLASPDFIDTVPSGAMGFSVNTAPYDLKAGDIVTVYDGTTTKVHTVTSLTVTSVNVDMDTVSGSAEPGTWVGVAPYEDWFGMPYGAIADGVTGEWTLSFAGDYDIVVGTSGGAMQFDDDADATEVVWTTVPNTPPVLDLIGEKDVDEGTLLTFTVTATDADGDTLTYELVGDIPDGASIDPVTGVFTWTPTEAQGPHTYMVSVSVSDGEGGQDGASVPVTVNEVNVAPVLAAIGSKSATVGEPLSFTATATDSDIPGNTLTFSLDPGAPAGASITGGGAFSWTPAAAGSFPVTVRVSDGTASDFEIITITVSSEPPPNTPPVLAEIGPKSVNELSPLSFTASATDANGDTLTYSLGAGAPAGASIDPNTGAFAWTPSEAQGPSTPTVRISVSDGKGGTDFEDIVITVAEVNVPPAIVAIGDKGGVVGVPITFTVSASDSDLPANALTFSFTSAPSGAAITAGGLFTFTPAAVGSYPVTVSVSDGKGGTDTDTFTITVTEAPLELTVTNVAGANRIATAIEASKLAFPAGADAVVIATARNWPDALGGSALAGVLDAPILLVEPTALPAAVATEISRLGAAHAVILGGTGAVSAGVASAIGALPTVSSVERIAGPTRYETAAAIAEEVISLQDAAFSGFAFVATGANFPDALGASPLAAAGGTPIYLANPAWNANALDDFAALLDAAGVTNALILGGTGAVPAAIEAKLDDVLDNGVEDRYAGSDRYETAVMVAKDGILYFGLSWDKVAIATGQDFPDALAGGVLQGRSGSVMLLSHTAYLDDVVADTLTDEKDTIFEVRFLGGTGAVSPAVRTAVTNILAK